MSIAAAMTLWLFMRYVHRQPIRSLGLGAWQHGKRWLLLGLVLGFGTVAVVGSIYLATQACRIAIHPDTWRVWRTLLASLPAMGLVAVLEELVFRGYLLRQLLACSQWLAVAGTSAAYAVVHLRTHPVWPGSALELTGLFLLGWILALGALRTRQLYFAIGLHAALAYCANVNKLLVAFPESSLQWLVGTNRLVNGVAAWVALLIVAGLVTRLKTSQTG